MHNIFVFSTARKQAQDCILNYIQVKTCFVELFDSPVSDLRNAEA